NEILSEDGKLDDEGRASFEVEMPAGAPVPSSLEAVITARVQEQGGRGVAAMERLDVHPYPYYIGIRQLGETMPEPGREVEFEFVAVDPSGKEVPYAALRADLFEDRWNTVLRRVPGGGFRYESTRDPVLADTRAVAGGKGKGKFRFTPREYGSYRAVLTDPETQASAEVEFYAAGFGYSPWAVKNPARLEIDLDRPEGQDYAPGDTATVQVRAPFAGKLLVTVERDQVLYHQVYDVDGNTARIEIPIREEFRPNAYVTATLVRRAADLEPGSAGRAFGAVPLPVDRTANRLRPEIAAPAEIRPNTKLEIGVKAEPGAVVTVAAVDEGILQLIAQKTPEPFEHFYRKLALGVTSYDTFSLVMPEVKAMPAGGGEGADGMAQYVRTEGIRRVEPVAFWSGPVVADGEGNVRVTFNVPEFQGALRLMAVAIDGDRFGSAERKTRVRDPIVLLPTLPRILSFDESLQVPVSVRNDTGRAGSIQVGLTAQGPVRVEAPATQTVQVPNGRETVVYFKVRTGDASGDARFVVTASGNGEKSRATTTVGVRPDLPVTSVEETGGIDKAVLELPAPATGQMRPETLTRELRVSPLPLVQFAGKLRHLLRYPYGCLEQTLSTAFPLIYIGDLARALEPQILDPKTGAGDPAAMVQAGMRRISAMQLPEGGFALWPGGREVHPWGSLYAAHFLVESKRAGHPVDEGLVRRSLDWVAGQVKAKSNYGAEDLQRTVYGLYTLARAGRPDLGTMDFLREKHAKELRPESRALLAAAYASAGNPQALQGLLANLGEVEQVERQTGGNFNSAIRNRALLL
ncbi:MAG TPA: alpha-2-macroglobulin family protein, partial [Thermoanaerobaculia bacterium]|nr:alpha-2-macroglobulin family protein [Thermoanaerobaculia bacterium]